MTRTCIIHIGMHKTGSSSIQSSFNQYEMERYQYLDLGSPNHSGFFATLLRSNPESYHGNIKAGRTPEQVAKLRILNMEILLTRLSEVRGKSLIISAEDFSNASIEEIVKLKEILNPYYTSFRVIGYVRSPVAYMQSAFQQKVKGGTKSFRIETLYPRYRKRFEKFDEVFGPENVELYVFSRECLHGSDVVKDFAHHLGIEIPEHAINRVNESLSLEATAVLYAERKYGSGHGAYPGAPRDNASLVSALGTLGSRKLRFNYSLVEPILDAHVDDIAWMERRLGHSIRDRGDESQYAISSEEDLLEIATEQQESVLDLLMTAVNSKSASPQTVARWVDLLRTELIGHDSKQETALIGFEPLFTDKQMTKLESETLSTVAILRELAVSLDRTGKREAALRVIGQALKLRPNAVGLQKLYKQISTY